MKHKSKHKYKLVPAVYKPAFTKHWARPLQAKAKQQAKENQRLFKETVRELHDVLKALA